MLTRIAFLYAFDWVFVGFHAAVFAVVIIVLLAIQWLLEQRRGGRR